MVAKHTIMPGEEVLIINLTYVVENQLRLIISKVTDCYGLHHLSTLKEERAPAIQKGFLFTCKCQVGRYNLNSGAYHTSL